ncbi:sodium:alanine symporter family protein [Clostridium sp. MD294]|uniref:alanine/glycine:cation symporter family protein n=1 Tax=Clostridium sp. MD294 TaxID=97138 RepID=UPI0002C962C1|nr:sodium:alanine symporter family protein [Clostridium sp. MD294]NDO46719.1 sodium:alanine symporter family protein [Clostridium sp. MD294]USF28841.1 Amino-acid carrier protein AlsT [Clostridium sp. MD294]
MTEFAETLNGYVSIVNGWVWGPVMLILLFGTHLFLTIRTRVIQLHIFKAIKLSVTKDSAAEGDISQFGALTTALAATIGTGNIVGVATAVAAGGPGAVLWCWLTGVVGIATKYGEALLAVKYRVKTNDGSMLGGPMYALELGVGEHYGKLFGRVLGIVFALLAGIAAFGIGNMTQGNSISVMVQDTFGVSPIVTGLILMILTGVVVIGGVKSIAKVCEKLVPLMAFFYIIGCIVIIFINHSYIVPALKEIFSSAFSARAMGGGFVGATVITAARYGIARGLFSNESGLGSAPIAAAAAQTRNPVRQALVGMTGTFWDTVIVCALTGIVLVSSIIKDPASLEGLSGGNLTSAAFNAIPGVGPVVLTIGLITFAWSTILGWSYYGERAWEYLAGKKAVFPFRVVWVIVVFIGCVTALDLVWNIADTLNACMAFPNLVSLLLLSGVIVNETKKYLWENNLDATSTDIILQIDKN